MSRELQVLAEGAFFEGPRWRDGRWWVSDFYRHVVSTVTPDGRLEPVWEVEHQPSGIGWLPDGSMLVVSMKDRRLLRRSPQGEVSVHADLSQACIGAANDMVVDREGRAYVAHFGFDLQAGEQPVAATLVRVDPDGRVHTAAGGLHFPNGPVITPDGRTLIVGETLGNRFSAFTVTANGELVDGHVWAQFAPVPAPGPLHDVFAQIVLGPDGCTLDAEGQIWAADPLHNRCVRVAEGGTITDVIESPNGMGIYAAMLGGEDGRTLLLCAATTFLPDAKGILLATRVEVPHAGLP